VHFLRVPFAPSQSSYLMADKKKLQHHGMFVTHFSVKTRMIQSYAYELSHLASVTGYFRATATDEWSYIGFLNAVKCHFNVNASVTVLKTTWRKRFVSYLKDVSKHNTNEQRLRATNLICEVVIVYCAYIVSLTAKSMQTPEGIVPQRGYR
jgi:hypothetical protein